MALDLSKLTAYVDEQRLPLLRNAVIGSRTAKEFYLMTGVKGTTALNLLDTSVKLGAAACSWNPTTNQSLSQRNLVPGFVEVQASYCDKQMQKYWMNEQIRIAAGQKTLPFEEEFIAGVVEGVKANLEKSLWQGDVTKAATNPNIGQFDGIIKIADAADLAATVEYATGATISSIVNDVYAKIPSAAFEKGEVVLYMGSDSYRKLIQEYIANSNIVVTNTMNDVGMPMDILIPGTNVRIIPVAGLDNTGRFFASYKDNFVYGTDMTGDEEKFDMWYSKDNQEFRLDIQFTAGVQIAYPDMVVTAKEQQ